MTLFPDAFLFSASVQIAAGVLTGATMAGLATTMILRRHTDGKPDSVRRALALSARPASHCPSCQTPLGPLEKSPFIGYAASLGHCAHCHIRIPIRYLLAEAGLLLPVLFLLVFTAGTGWGWTATGGALAYPIAYLGLRGLKGPGALSLIAAGLLLAIAGFTSVTDGLHGIAWAPMAGLFLLGGVFGLSGQVFFDPATDQPSGNSGGASTAETGDPAISIA